MGTKLTAGKRFKRAVVHAVWLCAIGLLSSIPFNLISATDVQAQSLGRLFSTPSLRAELQRRRIRESSGVVEILDTEPVTLEDLQNQQVVPDTIYELGGSMRRSDNSFTVWINNTPYAAADLPAHMELVMPYEQGQMRIRNPETGESFLVKPGQVLNLTQGQVMEAYQYRARRTAMEQLETSTANEDSNPDATEADEADGDASVTNDAEANPSPPTVDGLQ